MDSDTDGADLLRAIAVFRAEFLGRFDSRLDSLEDRFATIDARQRALIEADELTIDVLTRLVNSARTASDVPQTALS